MTSHYNVFFNGTESFKKGIKRAETAKAENYSRILPIFYYSDKDIAQSVNGDMDRAIKKASKVITLHSITAKPELKKGPQSPKQKEFYNKKEYNRWIDDNYLLMGKAYVYQNQFSLAGETFRHIIASFTGEPVVFSALIWLSRVNIETGEFTEAEKILTTLQSDRKMPKKYRQDFYLTYADYWLKQKDFAKSAQYLEKALKLTWNKHYRLRYTYILAQVYQAAGKPEKALKAFRKVVKMKPPYEMTFNAKINMAGSFQAGSEGGKEIVNLLRKMIKDEKNKDFLDQIYYALGNIAMKEGRKDEAVDLYKQSVYKSVNNVNQKGLSYLALGDYYYSIPDYAAAQAYYDSTMQNIENSYEDYDALSKKTKSLTHLVENLVVYELEDSVQMLAKLPEAELNERIDKIIAVVIKKEEEEAKRKQEEMLDQQFGMMNQNRADDRLNSDNEGSSWYFYNLAAKGFGQPDFRMRWGNRKLEDNWRRKNKQVVENFETAENAAKSDSAGDSKTVVLSTKTREFYLQNIPFTDSALQSSTERLVNALFNMGEIYRKEFGDMDKSISCFQELISKYPDHKLVFPSYYNLYEIYGTLNNEGKREEYKNLMISKFPDNPRSKILADPEYVKQMEKEMNKVNDYYEDTYNNYKSGNYPAVVGRANYAISQYKGDDIIPRIMLLKALSVGQLQGKEQMKTELDTLISHYPEHEVSKYAQELIDYIYSMSPEIKTADITAKAEEIYVYDSAEVHFLAIAAIKKTDINQINFNLLNFNLDNYENLNLNILMSEVSDHNILAVMSFGNLEKARRYYTALNDRRKDIIGNNSEEDVRIFLISKGNFDKLVADKALDKYLLFYQKHY
jgi:tetratricopeptide (TPR) repeat protein